MNKDELHNKQHQSEVLINELESKQHNLELNKSIEDNFQRLLVSQGQQQALKSELNAAQSDCSKAQVGHQQATTALSQSSAENIALNNELHSQKKLFAVLAALSNKYREFEGIAVKPAVVITEKLSAEELVHSDVLKVTCKEKCKEAFDLALSKIINVNFQDVDGRTILMHAIINGFYYGVDKLLQKGADVTLLDKQGANALFYCTQIPHIKYFKQIAEKTIDFNYRIPTIKNGSFLHSLIKNPPDTFFISELKIELKDCNQNHCSRKFNLTYEKGFNEYPMTTFLGARESDGYTIHQGKTLYIIKYLVSKGADINLQDDDGLTPFFLSCAYQLKYISKELMDHFPIDWGLIDNFGYNALQWVLELRDKELVKQVINKGQDVNHKDQIGNTALFWAAKYILPDIVDLLFNTYNATDLTNNYGLTAWDIATLNIQTTLIEVLITKKGIKKEFVELWCAAKSGNMSLVEKLLNNDVDSNLIIDNYNNSTPLIQSVINNHVQVIELLLQHGADINKADKEGASPLYYSLGYAGQQVNLTIVKLLLSKGANVNQAMFDGNTPLHMASYQANINAMKILLNNGALIDTKNGKGKIPLGVLIEKQGLEQDNKLSAIKYLLIHSTYPLAPDIIDLAKKYFGDVVPWLEHPENLPTIGEFEASICAFSDELK